MARASKQQAAEHHREILAAASQLFRGKGVAATSVPEIMQAAGMTHGGFYGHFASKDALAAEATAEAFAWLDDLLTGIAARHPGDGAAARRDLVETYLSPSHRDHADTGCPVAALATDMARAESGAAAQAAYTAGLQSALARLTGDTAMEPDRPTALADYATLVGALLLARATAGSPLSDELLAAARDRLAR